MKTICCKCHKLIRDEPEKTIPDVPPEHQISHGYCPECAEEFLASLDAEEGKKKPCQHR